MRSNLLSVLLILASSVTRAEPPVPAPAAAVHAPISAADAKAIDEYLLPARRGVPRHVLPRQDPAARVAANLRKAAELPVAPRPYSTECRGDSCYRYDGRGKLLFRFDRETPRNAALNENQVRKVECLGKDDLLDTFERVSRCHGIGLRLPTPWDPIESVVPIADRP